MEKEWKKILSRIPFLFEPGKKITKKIAKKFKKLKNLFLALFLAKTGWDKPKKWKKKKFTPEFRSYSTHFVNVASWVSGSPMTSLISWARVWTLCRAFVCILWRSCCRSWRTRTLRSYISWSLSAGLETKWLQLVWSERIGEALI